MRNSTSFRNGNILSMQSISRLRTLPPLIHSLRPVTRPTSLSINHFRLTPCHKAHESNMSLDEWKTRAPYRIHENTEDFKVRYEGGCHCGRVKYQLSRETPLAAKYCHCTTCQTLHGKLQQFLPYLFPIPSFQHRVTHLRLHCQELLSNGPPSSTKKTSTSPTVTMIWVGTTAPRKQPSTSCLAKSAVRTAERRSWMKGGT